MQKILVLGGTGFVGRHVCEALVRAGLQVTVATRRAKHAAAVQTLPGLEVLEANVHSDTDLARLLPGHSAVVNLVAILHGNARRFQQVHVDLPSRLVQAMAQAGVKRLVHISALGAAAEGPSRYLASKHAGETAVRNSALDWTVLRPSVVFGAEDRLLNTFARLQTCAPVVPLAGADTRFQPVWVGDVAQAVARSLQSSSGVGQVYEVVGPDTLTLADLVRVAGRLSGHPRPVIGLPVALGYFQAALLQCLPGEPLMSTDNLRSMEVDNVASGQHPGLLDLGITASALEPVAALYLDGQGRADPLLRVRSAASGH